MKANSNITIGIDEVGRGSWAGPLVVCAVALNMNKPYEGLTDSKKLTARKRSILDRYIKREALAIGIGWVNPTVLDKVGLSRALDMAAEDAYRQLGQDIIKQAKTIIVDGDRVFINDERAVSLVKADDKVQAVSAASIIAKVARDRYMTHLDILFTDYNFSSHVGYGTAAHRQALQQFGPLLGVHRYSFAPVKDLLDSSVGDSPKLQYISEGAIAEDVAADYLMHHDYEILERNWKTKYCEIDIVARRGDAIYFVEVKYRKNDIHGDGLDAITPKKFNQMKFGAKFYMHAHKYQLRTCSPQLMVMALANDPITVTDVVTIDHE